MRIGSKVILQTAQGVVKGTKKKRVRVVFDLESEKSFVTARVMNQAGLSAIRKELLEIKTFGGSGAKGGLFVWRLSPLEEGGAVYIWKRILCLRYQKSAMFCLISLNGSTLMLNNFLLSDVCNEKGC